MKSTRMGGWALAVVVSVAGVAAGGAGAMASEPVLEKQSVRSNPAGQSTGFGTSIDSAGDVDGDGIDDLIVGAHGYAYLYRGSRSGLEASPSWSVSSSGGDKSQDYFGTSVAGVGDVNDDGYDDVLVGDVGTLEGRTSNGWVYLDGAAYLYLGSSSGLSSTADRVIDPTHSHFGGRVSAAGDVDGDGHDDVLIAAVRSDRVLYPNCADPRIWSVHLYRGTDAGLEATESWSAEASKQGTCFGYAISEAGDVDGDGFDDVVIGAYSYTIKSTPRKMGKAYVYGGSPSGLGSSPMWTKKLPQMDGDGYFAQSVSGGGDVDGDGYDDVLISGHGDYRGDSGTGEEVSGFVFEGSASGLSQTPDEVVPEPNYNHPFKHFVFAGDVNADGYDDVVVGTGVGSTDLLGMYHGSSSGLVTTPAWNVVGGGNFGSVVDGAGDVDGDGFADIAAKSSAAGRHNQVHVFRGAPNPPPTARERTVVADRGHFRDVALEGEDLHDDPLTFSVASQPRHGSLSGLQSTGRSTAEITYSPPGGTKASDSFEFEVTDPYGHTDTAEVEVTVESPPEFVPPTPTDAVDGRVGAPVRFTVAAEDPDGDSVSYGVEPMPDGGSIDETTGEFEWTPAGGQSGNHTVDVTASDGVATIRRQVVIRIEGGGMDAGGGGDTGRDAGRGRDVTSSDARMANDANMDGRDTRDGGVEDVGAGERADVDAARSEDGTEGGDDGDAIRRDASAADSGESVGSAAATRTEGCGCLSSSSLPPPAGAWLLVILVVACRRADDETPGR